MILSVTQYLIYLIAGMFLLLAMGAYATVSAGVGSLGLILILASLIISLVIAGLSFFLPRLSAAAAIVLALPFNYFGISEIVRPSPVSEPLGFLIPGILITGISVVVLIKVGDSLWSLLKNRFIKSALVILALAPAFFAVYIMVRFFSSISLN